MPRMPSVLEACRAVSTALIIYALTLFSGALYLMARPSLKAAAILLALGPIIAAIMWLFD